MPDKRLILVDGYSLLFRAFFATKFLTTTSGLPTNALYGFTMMLFNIIEKERPEAVVVAFDAPGKTFRHAEFEEYKGTRRDTPSELQQQLPLARDLMAALGIPSIEATGYEADDIIGTLATKAEENGYRTFIISGDLDALQLVDPCISLVTPKQGVTDTVIYDPAAVRERFGFGPEHITDYKAIKGDTSDNIPGVPGIGDKGAAELIQSFGTIENLLESWEEVPEKYRKKIEPVRGQLKRSKWLATIDREVPIEYGFEKLSISPGEWAQAQQMLENLEFRSLAKRLPLILGPYLEGSMAGVPETLQLAQEAIEVNHLGRAKDFLELTQWLGVRPYALVLQSKQPQASMFEEAALDAYIAHENELMQVSLADAYKLFESDPTKAILYDSKFLYKKVPGQVSPPRFDAMLAGYVLQSARASYPLADLVKAYLDIGVPETPEEQAVALFHLDAAMSTQIEREGQTKIFRDVEMALVPVLAGMEQVGIGVSREMLLEFSKSLEAQIEQRAQAVHELAGSEFNIGSPKQLGEILFEKLCIPGAKKTKTGYATGAEILQELALTYEIAAEVLNWRELTKLKSTYADALPKMIREDGRIHTSYNQTVAATGRLSSNEPNLQNIPIRTELGRQIRKAFITTPGFQLASFDYSQIELRILAHMCGDDALVEAFQTHQDVHTATAALMFNIEKNQVSKDQRNKAKLLNYAVLYGVSGFGLATQLGVGFSVAEAGELMRQYDERFPKIKGFTRSMVEEARSKGYTTTLLGRRRYFPDIHAANRVERQYAERQAMNAPLQGTAADMIKLAMIDVARNIRGKNTRMLLQVHDELVFELAEGENDLIEPIRKWMEDALPLSVPVEVDAKCGPNWFEMSLVQTQSAV